MNDYKIWAKKPITIKENNQEQKIIITLSEHTNHLLEKFEEIKHRVPDYLHHPLTLAIQLHDIGKALPLFQRKLGNKNYQPFDLMIDIYHSIFSVLLINNDILSEELEKNKLPSKDYLRILLSSIAFHHWRERFNEILAYGSNEFQKLAQKDESFKNQIIKNLLEEVKQIKNFNLSLIKFDHDTINGLANEIKLDDYLIPPYNFYFLIKRLEIDEKFKKDWIIISGFLMRCDHFASFCEQENFFEPIEISSLDENLITKIIVDSITNNKTFTSTNHIWQLDKVNELKNTNGILIAPTGKGKTEFAFLWAGENKFFYTLPIRAAVEQTFKRAKSIYNSNSENKVGLIHFDADVFLLKEENEENAIKLYDNARQLAFPVNICTGDQFFPYALKPPYYEKIYSVFSYSRLIVDEIQAYDPVAAAVIVKFVEDVQNMGGKSLIMTATFPAFIKDEIEKRLGSIFSNELKILNLYEEEKLNLVQLKKHKLKFLLINNEEKSKENLFELDNEIINQIINLGKTNRVLVIFNTINQAQKIYEKIKKICDKENIELHLLHSRFTFNDRSKIQEDIKEKFENPKSEDDKSGKILIATQVVEAAIDIDADYLFTEIAPLDALIQRMGRVLRRYNKDFQYNGEPNVNIILFEKGNESGNGRVYTDELIDLTKIILTDLINKGNINSESIKKLADTYYVSNNSKKKSKKKKTELNISTNSILISEYDKYELVNLLFELMSKSQSSKYLNEFYKTLELLDAGYSAEQKLEAQRKFRPMITTQVISSKLKNKLKEKLQNYLSINFNDNNDNKNKRPYTKFKEKIISQFVVNVNGLLNLSSENSLSAWILENFELSNDAKDKLCKWTEDIYFVDVNYDEKKGLDGKIKEFLINQSSPFL